MECSIDGTELIMDFQDGLGRFLRGSGLGVKGPTMEYYTYLTLAVLANRNHR